MDGTFKITKTPFKQLFSIHAFIRKGESMKQIPLMYVVMSRRLTQDYVAVFKRILEFLPHQECEVREVVADFEKATWNAVLRVFPGVSILGCGFHWAKAVFSKIKKIGLGPAYSKSDSCRSIMPRFLVLNLLPAGKIKRAFHSIKSSIPSSSTLFLKLSNYKEKTWLKDRLTTERWSVYG